MARRAGVLAVMLALGAATATIPQRLVQATILVPAARRPMARREQEGGSAQGHEGGDRRRARLQERRRGQPARRRGKITHDKDGKPVAGGAAGGGQEEAGRRGKETETHHANGKPKKNEKGEDLDAEGKVVAEAGAEGQDLAELALKPGGAQGAGHEGADPLRRGDQHAEGPRGHDREAGPRRSRCSPRRATRSSA
jgi:hypothetical protein